MAASKAGAKAELVVLPDLGFKGNSHMIMQDKNSLEIAKWISNWMDRTVPRDSTR